MIRFATLSEQVKGWFDLAKSLRHMTKKQQHMVKVFHLCRVLKVNQQSKKQLNDPLLTIRLCTYSLLWANKPQETARARYGRYVRCLGPF